MPDLKEQVDKIKRTLGKFGDVYCDGGCAPDECVCVSLKMVADMRTLLSIAAQQAEEITELNSDLKEALEAVDRLMEGCSKKDAEIEYIKKADERAHKTIHHFADKCKEQAAEIERLRSICDRRAIEINTMAEEIERLNFLYDQASNKLPARLQDFKGQIIKEWKEKCAKVADGVKCGANKDDAPTDRANDFACEYIATAIRNLPEGDE